MNKKQHLIAVTPEIAFKLRNCSLYQPGDSYRVIIEKLLRMEETK